MGAPRKGRRQPVSRRRYLAPIEDDLNMLALKESCPRWRLREPGLPTDRPCIGLKNDGTQAAIATDLRCLLRRSRHKDVSPVNTVRASWGDENHVPHSLSRVEQDRKNVIDVVPKVAGAEEALRASTPTGVVP